MRADHLKKKPIDRIRQIIRIRLLFTDKIYGLVVVLLARNLRVIVFCGTLQVEPQILTTTHQTTSTFDIDLRC